MSNALINRSPDLKKLRDEGYDIEIRHGHLLVKDVPHLNSRKEVGRGILVAALTLAGDVAAKPGNHVAHFIGEYPCHKDGSEISQMKSQSGNQTLGPDLVINHSFSAKPKEDYKDFHEKMVTYVSILSGPAQLVDPGATATTFPANEAAEGESVFNYLDTASSRAGIDEVTKKLEIGKVGIIGLGGTGSYILDLVAKTPVKEIHLFDGDKFLNHNAFRSPGAPSIDELRQKTPKVVYFKELYSKMHRHIILHDYFIDATNVEELRTMDFVFLSLDKGKIKQLIVERLEEWNMPFIDVGMGVDLVDGALHGILRVTSSTPKKRDHVRNKQRIPFADGDGDDDYSRNIQIADLNALNAILAVVKWKKLCGFYHDLENEHFSAYTIDGNTIVNEDQS